MPKVLIQLSRWLLVITLILSLGVHWAFLQSVAWVGMVITYSSDSTFTQALSKTFDGKHPCKMCKVVQEGQKSEKKESALKVELKKEFWNVAEISIPCAPTSFVVLPTLSDLALNRTETPPVPPPRGFFV